MNWEFPTLASTEFCGQMIVELIIDRRLIILVPTEFYIYIPRNKLYFSEFLLKYLTD